MSEHSIADAKNAFSELIDRANKGEEIIVTKHGKPVAKITPIQAPPKRITQADIDWLDKHRVKGKIPKENAAQTVRRMRDEDWAR